MLPQVFFSTPFKFFPMANMRVKIAHAYNETFLFVIVDLRDVIVEFVRQILTHIFFFLFIIPFLVDRTSGDGTTKPNEQETQRTQSVIMKVEDQRIVEVPTKELINRTATETTEEMTICKWANCYR